MTIVAVASFAAGFAGGFFLSNWINGREKAFSDRLTRVEVRLEAIREVDRMILNGDIPEYTEAIESAYATLERLKRQQDGIEQRMDLLEHDH